MSLSTSSSSISIGPLATTSTTAAAAATVDNGPDRRLEWLRDVVTIDLNADHGDWTDLLARTAEPSLIKQLPWNNAPATSSSTSSSSSLAAASSASSSRTCGQVITEWLDRATPSEGLVFYAESLAPPPMDPSLDDDLLASATERKEMKMDKKRAQRMGVDPDDNPLDFAINDEEEKLRQAREREEESKKKEDHNNEDMDNDDDLTRDDDGGEEAREKDRLDRERRNKEAADRRKREDERRREDEKKRRADERKRYDDDRKRFAAAAADGKGKRREIYMALRELPERTNSIRSFFIFKSSADAVPRPRPTDTLSSVSSHFEWGVTPSHPLVSLERILKDVVMPLADPESYTSPDPAKADRMSRAGSVTGQSQHSHTSRGSRTSHTSRILQGGSGTASQAALGASGSIRGQDRADKSSKGEWAEEISDTVRNEFSINAQKFASQLQHTIQQVTGNVHLPIPDIGIDGSSNQQQILAAASNHEILQTLEETLNSWINIIAHVIDQEGHKEPRYGEGPMSAITFWRERDAVLSALYEQLNRESVKNMIKVAEAASFNQYPLFKKHMMDLVKLYVEAKDNVKFLATLERHFKNLSSGNLSTILDTIPSMMNSLRMVWIISRHFNRDNRMGPLMLLIAKEIAEKVMKEINVRTIFRRAPAEAMLTIDQGKQVLEMWHDQYVSMRQKIEESGTENRWEFNRNKLFDQTIYMTKICENLYEVAETLDQFKKFLGNELKTVTGDARGIDSVLDKVHALTAPLEILPFNIFHPRHQGPWEQHMTEFRAKVEEIEGNTTRFINSSFQKLRDAEGAFDLLQNFNKIESRPTIETQMMAKFKDILVQYSKELKRVEAIFHAGKDAPPVSKNQPPIAGAIAWSRSLYHRVKKSILRFQTMADLLHSDSGKEVSQQYLTLAKQIDAYEKELLRGWQSRVESSAKKLKDHIFAKQDVAPPPATGPSLVPVVGPDGKVVAMDASNVTPSASARGGALAGGRSSGVNIAADAKRVAAKRSALASSALAGGASTVFHGAGSHMSERKRQASNEDEDSESDAASVLAPTQRIVVNFAPELREIIRETKYLDRMGVDIPELALNIALQEKKYYHLVEKLNAMLQSYQAVIDKLTDVERKLLQRRIRDLQRVLDPGFDPLNWTSLAIPEFLEACERGIALFETIVNHVQKNSEQIKRLVTQIRNAKLMDVVAFEARTEVLSIEEVQDRVEKYRINAVEELVKKYKAISPLLITIERQVCDSECAAAEEMYDYYLYWERRIFNALTNMIAVGMTDFQNILAGLIGGQQGPGHPPLPLLRVTAEMNPTGGDNKITVTPSIHDVYKLLSKLLKNIPESAKNFVRWNDGTCQECPPIPVGRDEAGEVMVYTFYHDLTRNPVVVTMMLAVTQAMSKVIGNIGRYVESWGIYDSKYYLWNAKKFGETERLRVKPPPVADFAHELARYQSVARRVDRLKHDRDIEFIRLDCYPLIVAIKQKALEWVAKYGEILRETAEAQLAKLNSKIEGMARNLDKDTSNINDLKFVLNTVSEIQESNMEMELSFAEVLEKFRLLKMYDIPVQPPYSDLVDERWEEKERQRLKQLEDEEDGEGDEQQPSLEAKREKFIVKKWSDLQAEAKRRDASLVHTKMRFTEVTREQIRKFQEEVKAFRDKFDVAGPALPMPEMTLDDGLTLMKTIKQEIKHLAKDRDNLVLSEKLFDLEPTNFSDLYYVEDEMSKLTILYDLYTKHKENVKKWSSTPWAQLETTELSKGVGNFIKHLKRLGPALKKMPVYKKLNQTIDGFKESLPLISSLKQESLRDRHWTELMRKTGVNFELDLKTITLTKVFAMELHKFKDQIAAITNTAQNEMKIEKEIAKVAKFWNTQQFSISAFNGDESRGWLLQDCSEILSHLEEDSLSLAAMTNSPFAQPAFTTELRTWEFNLNHIAECIKVWLGVQRKWMYLEGIFIGSDDIRQQLPEAAKRFERIDNAFKKIMAVTQKNANVLQACQVDHRIDELEGLSDELERCQKSLSDYLERKRNAFPRFFFISDDELLSILGSADLTCIQPHMMKMFSNCKELIFARETVAGMRSSGEEEFMFRTPTITEGAVETWMLNVEQEMVRTLQVFSKEAVFHYAKSNRLEWIYSNLGMVTIGGSQIWWTWEVEDAFKRVKKGQKYAMKFLAEKLTKQLNDLVDAIRDINLKPPSRRQKLNTLIIIDVHARDIIDKFVRDSILDIREFDWESQLRFYWDRDVDDLVIRQCTGDFRYGYEYMGLSGRLVITPLTDRCYMTLTQALTFHLGGSPAGPAGTGKTETVKDLAKAMGYLCIVTNCGEGLDYRAMGSIFSGLVQTGAWGCFDEFNRINVEVLSVVSSQLQTIQMALNGGKAKFEFIGKEINLRPSVGFFITMNPGYAGRTELPDNLKALFRPVTMVVPDFLQICEIMLFSEGFISARVLAKKMTVLYHLAQEQLSKQTHYDFGLRALKAVLVMAGSLKRESPEYTEELVLMRALRDMNLPKFVVDDVELFLGLIGDLFPGMDCPRVTRKDLKNAVIEELEKDGYSFRHNDPDGFAEQVNKIIQLYEVMQTRHTTMVVGPTGGGKSVVIQTLAKAEKRARGVTVKLLVLNPKSVTVPELYGVLDPTTRDWTDGLLSKLFVEANEPLKPDQPEARYIVFDGDVDALWVENMNSVMDDNKLLTQPNGKRILLEDHVKLLFEVADLQYASPATVSRCGMVYVDPRNLGYAPYFWRWLATRCNGDERLAELLQSLYDRYIDQCVNACLYGTDEKGKPLVGGVMETIIPVTALGMVKQFCTLLSSLLTDLDKANEAAAAGPQKTGDGKEGGADGAATDAKSAEEKAVLDGLEGGLLDEGGLSALTRHLTQAADSKRGPPPTDLMGGNNNTSNANNANADDEEGHREGDGDGEHKDGTPPRDQEVVESLFIFCLVWSIGGSLKKEARFRFQNYVKTISNRTCVSTALKGHLPEESLYDFWFNLDPTFQRWQKWEAPKYVRPAEMVFARVLVPTVDTIRYTHFLGRYLDAKRPLLLVGESGTAKTVTVRHHLSNLDARKFVSLGINFSSRTQSSDVQTIIESNVDQRTGNIYGPTPGTQMVVFIDDLNMPRVDEYGTQQPIALLKFLIERDAMYERPGKNADQSERAVKKLFRDLLYFAAMAPPGGGRNAVDPRFISLFNVMGVPLPDDDSLLLIYSSIIHSHMEHYSFHEDIHEVCNKLTPLTIKLYHDLCTKLLPTPDRFHYVFNLRDLSRVYEGLLRSRPDKFETPASFVRLWRNEVLRVFHDRLITEGDKKLVRDDLVAQLIHDNFPNETKHACSDPILFGDYRQINSEVDSEVRMYEDLGGYDTIKGIFNEVLVSYNEEQDKNLNLVLFQDALEHVTRIHRIIRMPRGNALLVGVGGSGKQSLAKLACYASGYRVYQISLQRVYGEDQFKDDLKQLYHVLGAEKGGSPVVFLFTDAHVKHESFLEMINNMLTSGMVPALFTEEERLPLIDSVREECRSKGIMINRESCWNFFVNKCVDNLHVVLSMSPGETLRRRCRNFPGLVNNTVIDWFFPWPQAALHAVAEHFLANEEHISDAHRPHIVNHMVLVHDSVGRYSHEFEQELRRPNHVTPKNYLDYINNYRKQLTSNRDRNKQQYERLEGGLKKLVDANEAVEAYGEELNERKKIVDAKAKEVQQMIANIKERQAEVERKQKIAQEKEGKLREDSVHIKYEAEQADKALAEAEPLLKKAAEALNVLDKKDIAEVKGMPNPPVGVLAVCQCVLELKPTGTEKPEEGWKAAKVMMTDANFLKNLKTYKKDNISESQIKRVNKILRRKPNDPKQKLNFDNLVRISRAAAGLFLWVDAIVKYNKVSRQVLPRREKVLEMQRVMDRSQRELKQIEEELTFLQNQIAEHNRRYVEKSDELKDLEQKAEQMEKHLLAASQLISGLESEKLRWGHEKDRLAITKARLVGDCLLAAAFLSYAGAFTFEYRQRMIFTDWAKDVQDRGIPLTNGFKLEDLLSSPVEISRWTQEGLPPDQLSIQNGILTTRSSRWPLCIDPQMQAVKWIKSKESKTQASVMDREKQARFAEKKQREKKREQDRAMKRMDEEKERKAAEKQARDKRDRDSKKSKKDDSKDEKRGGGAAAAAPQPGVEDGGDDEATAMGWESGTLGEGHELKAWTFNDDFMRPLEWAISLGQPFLFEGVVEELDPILDPILEKNLITTAQGTRAISLGDNHNIDWNDNFRLYFITKLSNPKFSPEIAGKTMIINYSVTMQGLEDQLLTVVLGKERDDLRGAREELIQTIAQNNIALAGLEEDILRELNFATGNILDNNVLIETLKNAKSKSASIQDQQVESRETQKEIERVTDNYRPAATRGAILFFAMSGLSAISSMYEFALASYLEVFQRSLDVAQLGRDASSVSKRVNNIIDELTRNVYEYVCTGIFERHKTMFSLQMTTMIMDGAGKLNREELDFFLKGNVSLSDSEKARPAEWIPEGGWRDLQRLVNIGTSVPTRIDPSKIGTDDASAGATPAAATPAASSPTNGGEEKKGETKTPSAGEEKKEKKDASDAKKPAAPLTPVIERKKGKFSQLVVDIVENLPKWKDWFDDEHPEMVAMPCGYSTSLNSFQQLLILRCLRPDRVYNAVQRFIVEQMGESFVTPPTLFLPNIFKQSSPTSPVVFILSPGADPRADLEELAKQHNMFPQFFKPLALGQGQSKEAEKLVINGYSRGHWVLLQNCHLLTSWLKTLEKLLLALPATGKMPHKDFRLWLTTDPTPEFPLGILQRALKVVTEPPDKLKQNMKGTYSKLREADLEECAHTAYRPLVYVLSFFHAVVQERRKYGKLGWNVSYDFNDSDFNVSRRLLAMYLTKAHVNKDEMIPWNSLRYLIGEAMYGGRVTDSYDRRILITYLEEYMGDFLFDDCQPFFFAESDATPDGDSKLAGLKYKYTVPTGPGTLESFSKAVSDLPRDQSPTVFGLHSNAEIRYNTDSVKSIWRNLIDLQPRGKSVGGGTSREEYIKTMAARLAAQVPAPEDLTVIKRELIKKNQGHRERALARLKRETRAAQLAAQQAEGKRIGSASPAVGKKEEKVAAVTPVPIDLDDPELDDEKDEDRTDGDDSFAATGAGNAAADAEAAKRLMQLPPTTTVLMQELERWNKLVIKMKDSLTELQKAMHGYVAMSNELEDLAAALFDGRIPQMWRRLAPHTQKGLGSWMVHFARRHDQYTRWIAEGRDLKVIWLSGLHVPESYLTALVQASCRRKKWPLDKSTLYTRVTSFVDEHQVKDKPVDGCYITGLHLEGAAWDHKNNCLRVQDPKVLVVELPILQVIPIESNKLKLQNTFKTPVYVTQNRRTAMGQGLVFEADLTTPVHPSHWILQGTALVLNTDV